MLNDVSSMTVKHFMPALTDAIFEPSPSFWGLSILDRNRQDPVTQRYAKRHGKRAARLMEAVAR